VKPTPPRPTTCWAVFNKGGHLLATTVRYMRSEATGSICEPGKTWEDTRKKWGLSVHKITVTPV